LFILPNVLTLLIGHEYRCLFYTNSQNSDERNNVDIASSRILG